MSAQVSAPAPSTAELLDARERTRIVEAARVLYLRLGIAEVSMADIARHVRIPEHAVRRWFPGPAPLVEAVVEAHADLVRTELSNHQERYSTAVEELLALRNWVSSELQHNTGPFFQQLEAQFPTQHQRWHAHMRTFPVAHLRANLHRGVEQGLYHATLDVEAQVASWFAQYDALPTTGEAQASAAERHTAMLNAFLATLVTPAGALVARRLQEGAPYY